MQKGIYNIDSVIGTNLKRWKEAKLESANVFGLSTASTSSLSSTGGTAANMNAMLSNATGLASASAVSASTFDSAALYQAQASTLTQ
ncbi:unnamed protein product, partial [Acanthocheilonema viteae]